jgi:hypothetical protein
MAHIQCGAAEPSSGAPQLEPGMSNAGPGRALRSVGRGRHRGGRLTAHGAVGVDIATDSALCKSGPNGEADSARRRVHRDNDGVPGDAQPQPESRRPPEKDRGPDHLGPRDDQEEDTVQHVFGEMFEYNREMDGRGADGERRQATQKARPDGGRLGADFLTREDRSAQS